MKNKENITPKPNTYHKIIRMLTNSVERNTDFDQYYQEWPIVRSTIANCTSLSLQMLTSSETLTMLHNVIYNTTYNNNPDTDMVNLLNSVMLDMYARYGEVDSKIYINTLYGYVTGVSHTIYSGRDILAIVHTSDDPCITVKLLVVLVANKCFAD